jgi:hypothetical protein
LYAPESSFNPSSVTIYTMKRANKISVRSLVLSSGSRSHLVTTCLAIALAIVAVSPACCQQLSISRGIVISNQPGINIKPITLLARPLTIIPYDIQEVNKRLRHARGLIIAGSVLTATGSTLFLWGGLYSIRPRGEPTSAHVHNQGSIFTAIFWGAASPEMIAGVPLLGVGLSQRHKWQKIKINMNIQSGIMSNGHVGLAVNF